MDKKVLLGLFVNTVFFICLIVLLILNNQYFLPVIALVAAILWNSRYILKSMVPIKRPVQGQDKSEV